MKPELKFGTIAGLVLGIVLFISMMSVSNVDVDLNNPWGSAGGGGGLLWWALRLFIISAALYMAVSETRKSAKGYISFKSGFGSAYRTAWVIILTYSLVSIVYYYVFNPDWYPISWPQYEEFLDDSEMPKEQLQYMKTMMKWVIENISALAIAGYIVMNAIAFAILSLIIAGILQNDNPDEIKL